MREPDRHEVVVRSAGLALGVDSLNEGDRVSFDIDTGTDWQVAPRRPVSNGVLYGLRDR